MIEVWFNALFSMWALVVDELGMELTDKGDTLYWRWVWPDAEKGLGFHP